MSNNVLKEAGATLCSLPSDGLISLRTIQELLLDRVKQFGVVDTILPVNAILPVPMYINVTENQLKGIEEEIIATSDYYKEKRDKKVYQVNQFKYYEFIVPFMANVHFVIDSSIIF